MSDLVWTGGLPPGFGDNRRYGVGGQVFGSGASIQKVKAAPTPPVVAMTEETRGYLSRQFEAAWKLASHHLDGLSTEECLWRPTAKGLHVHRLSGKKWRADWPDHEGYDIGPPSIAWTTWHMIFWWSMVLDHSFGNRMLTRDKIFWPGSADAVRASLKQLHDEWEIALAQICDTHMRSSTLTRWPYQDRPFGDVVAWLNAELMKNAAELGYARFLYAAG